MQNLKKEVLSSQTEKNTSTASNKKNVVASPSVPYDNKHILSVLDYLQEEIDFLKTQTQSKPNQNSATNNLSNTPLPQTKTFPQLSLNALDQDNDRFLSIQETQLSDFDFKTYDIDEDGKISSKELSSAKKRVDKAREHAEQRDSSDGAFPIEQYAWSRSQKEFNFIDQNNDLIIDEAEYVHYLALAKQQLRRFDYNRDTWISFTEFGQGEVRFAKIDNDTDQKIYEHEVRKAMYLGFW